MKIKIVIVLYNEEVSTSLTCKTLPKAMNFCTNCEYDVLVYDNSPKENHQILKLDKGQCRYVWDGENFGLAKAYDMALDDAHDKGIDYLLLLDQDTNVPLDFFSEMLNYLSLPRGVAALVPKVFTNDRIVSPVRFKCGCALSSLGINANQTGVQDKAIMAINSCSLICVDFFKEIGGFTPLFPIDYLDHWWSHEIYHHGGKIMVADLNVEHNLSCQHRRKSVDFDRFKTVGLKPVKYPWVYLLSLIL